MPQPLAHGLQAFDPGIDFVRLGYQHLSIDLKVHQHRPDLIQGKPGCLPQGDQCQPIRNVGGELAPLATPGERREQAFLFVVTQGRRRDACAFGDIGNVHRGP
ncbi:hypothetical protein D3C81_2000730 [compost metagenome]|jgi:hypothetical protein